MHRQQQAYCHHLPTKFSDRRLDRRWVVHEIAGYEDHRTPADIPGTF